MSKLFFEAFPTLELNDELRSLFEETVVDRVSTTASREYLHVYVSSNHLLPKQAVFDVEKKIKSQFFRYNKIDIKIYEKFKLSAQYTPEKLFDVYRESIFLEIKEYSHVFFNCIRHAKFEFPTENLMEITVEDNFVSRERKREIEEVFEKIFCDRCGLKVSIKVKFDLPATKDDRSNAGEAFKKVFPAAVSDADKPEENKAGAAKKVIEKEAPKKKERELSYSSNPDVIYGKDVDIDATRIVDIEGEIGVVAVRGKIIAVDLRETRKGDLYIVSFDVTDFTDTISCKCFIPSNKIDEFSSRVKTGVFVKVKGEALIDKFSHELTINSLKGIQEIPDFTEKRKDKAAKKRVELHCHTKMSDMDGVSEASDIRSIAGPNQSLSNEHVTAPDASQTITSSIHQQNLISTNVSTTNTIVAKIFLSSSMLSSFVCLC